MNRERMLEKCRRGQWQPEDLDWSKPPRPMTKDEETAIVQYFVDMSGIELLAGALFEEQGKKVSDPVLKEIFASFVEDEKRHSDVALRLARYYDVHKYKTYETNPDLVKFKPHFVNAVKHFSAEVANVYITTGELILDVALLRSLDDYVDDEMSHQAMHLINRDESRHIAVDFHMTEHYCSDEHLAAIRDRPWPKPRELVRGMRAVSTMMWYAKPFLQQVFLTPMDKTDPSGRRLHEAIKRIQLVLRKPVVARTPFSRFMITAQNAYNHPVIGRLFGRVLLRMLGAVPRAATILFTDDELERTKRMSFDELAEDALSAKFS